MPAIQKLAGHKIFQVFMVFDYLYGFFNIFQFRSPQFENVDDCQKLFVIDLVITFNRVFFTKKINDKT